MAEEEGPAHGIGGTVQKLMRAHLGPVPLPLAVGGVVVLGLAYYLYRKNASSSSSSSVAQPVAVPVNSAPSGGNGGGGNVAAGPDYSGQLAALDTGLVGLQSSLAGITSSIQGQQAALQAEQAQLAGLSAAQQTAQPPAPPAPSPFPLGPVPSALPAPSYASQGAAQFSQQAATPAYTQWYDQQFLSPAPSLPPAQQPFFYSQPASYSGPINPFTGFNIPSYMPLPQYGAQSHPYVGPNEQGTYVGGNYQPSSVFGSGANAFTVQGYYVTNPDGSRTWVT